MDNNSKIVILGAGLAGLSTAYHLKKDYEIYEKEGDVGGLCRSKNINGFTFDYDGHLLHFKNRYALDLLKKLMNGNLVKHRRNSWIYSFGTYTRYPFQANFFGLPQQISKECILGLIKAKYRNGNGRPENGTCFEDWILDTFGQGIARYFMLPYNAKFWTVSPRELTCEWIDGYIPVPTLEETVEGALAENERKFGYNVLFWYPAQGGIQEVATAFAKKIKRVNTSSEVIKIDIVNKEVKFRDNRKVYFDKLISTIPLPEIINLIDDLPENVISAIKKLRYTSILNLNLAIERNKISDKHWIYFPEKKFIFYRVGFSHNFSPHLTPLGKSSLYVEVSYSKDKPINKKKIVQRIIRDLIKADILTEKERILARDVNDIKYGYILYDQNYQSSIERILNFLNKNNIYSLGRYGSWRYMSMEDVILEGKNAAERIL